jgi:hypothetical protein
VRKSALKLHKLATSRSKTHRIATSRGSPATSRGQMAFSCGSRARGSNLVRFPARSGRFVRNLGPKSHKPATSRVKMHGIATWRGYQPRRGLEAAGLCGPFTRGSNLVRFLARGGRFVRNFGPKPHETATSRVETHGIATWRGLPPISGTCGLQLCGGCPIGWLRPRVRWGFKLLHRWLTGAESGNRHVTRVGPNLDSAKGCRDRQSAGCTSPGPQVRGLLARAMRGRNVHLVSGGALCTAD